MNGSLTVLYSYFKSYYTTVFKPAYFFIVLVMLSVLLLLNYSHPNLLHFVNDYSWLYRFSWYYFLYFLPFAAAYLFQPFFYEDTRFLKNKYFIALLLLAPAYFSFRVNFNFHHTLVQSFWKGDEILFWQHCTGWLARAVALIGLVIITWFFADRKSQPLYGFSKIDTAAPYFIFLLWMAPFIGLAAIQPDFLHTYPRAQMIAPLSVSNKPLHYFIFELCYAFDFVSIEFFFRGFLILAFIRYGGMQCIVPAACFYCCIHLGKPMAEAISSFAGGIFLGIISYHTKSIWGGLLVHIGIAALMEMAGFAAHGFLK